MALMPKTQEEAKMKNQLPNTPKARKGIWVLVLIGLAALVLSPASPAQAAAKSFRLGLVTFLSGPAAGPFGVPAKNAAEIIVEGLNNGTLPAPYATKGIAGMKIDPIYGDEAGGTTRQVSEFRNLVQRQKVNAVIGYISSGDILAIAPVAEELKTITVAFDTGTTRLFEEHSYKYVFRTRPTATMDGVGAARYLVAIKPDLKSVAGINQNYSWGQDSWRDFIAALKVLKPNVEVKAALFPKIFAGQYGSEISVLLLKHPQAIHCSFWGGDMESLLLQGAARGLFKKSLGIFTCGETAMYRLAKQIPEGTVLGARGPFGVYAPKSTLNTWFRTTYIKRFKTPPTYPAYVMAQAILGLKTAADKAEAANKGKEPTTKQIIAAFEHLKFEGPGGMVDMARGHGHQAVMGTAYGEFTMKNGKPGVKNVKRFAEDLVNPPVGMTAMEWIKGGMKVKK
jgi:branched-chain amino acid transport system substrate-binding protein